MVVNREWVKVLLKDYSPTVLVFLFIIGFSLGVTYDLIWFSMFPLEHFWFSAITLSIILICFSMISFILYQYATSVNWKRTKFCKITLDSRLVKISSCILVVSFVVLSFVSGLQPRDLNDVYHIERNNSESQEIIVNGSRVFFVSGKENVTSDITGRLYFWVDLDYYSNATDVVFAYHNGTSIYPEHNRTTASGSPDRLWYTDSSYYWWDSVPENPFGNSTYPNYLSYSIPEQPANTTVEYAFWIRTQEGTNFSYIIREGNYTVLYSQIENEYTTELLSKSHLFLGLMLIFIVANVHLYKEVNKGTKPDYSDYRDHAIKCGIINAQNNEHGEIDIYSDSAVYPSTEMMIQRSDRLDDIKNNIRTTSGAFITISVGFLIFLESQAYWQWFLQWMILGVYVAVLGNLYILVLSMSDDDIKDNGKTMSYDMLPPDAIPNTHRFYIFVRIQNQNKMLSSMRKSMQYGIYFIICGLIGDFTSKILQSGGLMASTPVSSLIFSSFQLTLVAFVFLAALWILYNVGVSYDLKVD